MIFNLLIQMRFLIYDDLIIDIDPLQSVLLAGSNEVTLRFDIQVKNFRFCRAYCELQLVDPHQQEVLANETLNLENGSGTSWEREVDLEMNGAGERIYYFYLTCKNNKGFLCRTDEEPTYRSAIVNVNRSYTPQELEELQELKDRLGDAYLELTKRNGQQEGINRTVKIVQSSIKTKLQGIQLLKPAFQEFGESLDAYYSQEFETARNLLGSTSFQEFEQALKQINESLSTYNHHVRILVDLSNATYGDAYEYYARTNNSKAGLMNGIYVKVKNQSMASFEEVVALTALPANFERINSIASGFSAEKLFREAEYRNDLEGLSSLGLLNLSGNLCDDLQAAGSAVQQHNSQVPDGPHNFSHILEFINHSWYSLEENQTHLMNATSSIPNDGGLDLSGYLAYVSIPEIPQDYCTDVAPLLNKSLTNQSVVPINLSRSAAPLRLGEPARQCCIYGECNTCSIDRDRYPVIFIHGHALNKENSPESSIKAFSDIQKEMSNDGLLVNAGDIDYSSAKEGYWSHMSAPVGVRATYYYFSYYDAESMAKEIRKEEGIESYAIRLKELVDIVLSKTGAEKVVIVAHSMGGLVTRDYLMLFGEDSVDRAILIATPNQGITGRTEQLCSYFGDQRACRDMSAESIFMKKLQVYVPGIPIYTIIGTGCDTEGKDGDGVVQAESSELPYAQAIYVSGNCESLASSLHKNLLNPEKYPVVYEALKEIIFTRAQNKSEN